MPSRPVGRDRPRTASGAAVLFWSALVLAACAGALGSEDEPGSRAALAATSSAEPAGSSQSPAGPSAESAQSDAPELGLETPISDGPVVSDDLVTPDSSSPQPAVTERDTALTVIEPTPDDAGPSSDDSDDSDDADPISDDAASERSGVPLAPELQPLPRSRWLEHHRAPRETLAQVAHRYDVDESKLREWNGLGPEDPPPHRRKRLRVRARRTPPPREPVEYTVQEGDTWWTIAMRHGVDSRDLRAYNWPRKGKMQPGATLQVWIDPVVHRWVTEGPDPVPLDRADEPRRGAIGIGSPANGILRNGLHVPEVEGIHLRLPRSAYGTTHAVHQLVSAIALFHERSDYPLPVELGSMSLPRGGEIGQHKSHQTGRDVDIRLLRRPDVSTWKASRGTRVQWDAVWDLVLAFAEVDAVVIFLDYKAQRRLYRAAKARGASETLLDEMIQYPGGHGSSGGLVRHEPGHDTHLHVRFGCGPFETECVRR